MSNHRIIAVCPSTRPLRPQRTSETAKLLPMGIYPETRSARVRDPLPHLRGVRMSGNMRTPFRLAHSIPHSPDRCGQRSYNSFHLPKRSVSFPEGDSFQSPGLRRMPLPRENHPTKPPTQTGLCPYEPPFSFTHDWKTNEHNTVEAIIGRLPAKRQSSREGKCTAKPSEQTTLIGFDSIPIPMFPPLNSKLPTLTLFPLTQAD